MSTELAFAEWAIDERDVMAAINARSGSTLALLRFPVGFLIAYLGVALPQGALFAVGSALAIVTLWLLASLGLRGSTARHTARASAARPARLSIQDDRIRYEWGNGHAREEPLSALTEANVGAKGILLATREEVYFVPRRALGANEEVFLSAAARVRPRWLPRGTWFTVVVWSFAVLVGAQGYYG